MPGLLPHLLAGSIVFFIGRYYFSDHFKGDHKNKEQFLLAVVCFVFSIIPDLFLGIYYTTQLLSFRTASILHNFTHVLFSPFVIIVLIILIYRCDIPRKSIWIMGTWALALHLTMDFLVHVFNIPYGFFI